MTTLSSLKAQSSLIHELVVYKIKSEHRDNFDQILNFARNHIAQFPGIVEYQTLRSKENDLVFMDLVTWNSLEEALAAAKQVETMPEMIPFMSAFEEIKFMDHFELFSSRQFNILDPMNDEDYYKASSKPTLVNIKPYQYLSIQGIGSPSDDLFSNSISALQEVAHLLKVRSQHTFEIAPLEGQWWVEGELPFDQTPEAEWHWNMVIPMPSQINDRLVEEVIQQFIKGGGNALASEIQLELLNEDKSIQILHQGPFDAEGPSIAKIVDYASKNELKIIGKHHEIYLNDPNEVKPSEIKVILRYAVE